MESNDPILDVYPYVDSVLDLPHATLAFCPIVGDSAVKGPAAKMMKELGMAVSATAVAQYYGDLIDGFVYDSSDSNPVELAETAVFRTDTLMKNSSDRRRVAQDVLTFAQQLIAS